MIAPTKQTVSKAMVDSRLLMDWFKGHASFKKNEQQEEKLYRVAFTGV